MTTGWVQSSGQDFLYPGTGLDEQYLRLVSVADQKRVKAG